MVRSDRRYKAVISSMRIALKRGEKLEGLAEVALKAADKKLYVCDECGKKYKNGYRLSNHAKSTRHRRAK